MVALSSTEAELYTVVLTSAEALAVQACARDIGMSIRVEKYADSSAALGIAKRAGTEQVRHLGPWGSGSRR